MKQRFWIFVIAVFFIVIIAIGALASQQPSNPRATSDTSISVTIQNNIGVKEVEVQNLNTGKTYIFTLLSLPASFNCTVGDYLQIRVVTHEGYRWNAWWFPQVGIWNNDNPMIVSASGRIVYKNQIIMRPDTLIIQQQTPENVAPYTGE